MALPSIALASFTGYTNISQSTYTSVDLSAKIAFHTQSWIETLFGYAFAYELESKIRNRYTLLYTGGAWTNSKGQTLKLHSLNSVLQLLIYANLIADQAQTNTSVGTVVNYNENSELQGGGNVGALMSSRMSKAANLWEASIVPFIEMYRSVSKEITNYTGLGGGQYRFDVEETTYLEVEDKVKINGLEYEILAVTSSSFDISITANEAAAAINTIASWEPFGLVKPKLENIQVGNF